MTDCTSDPCVCPQTIGEFYCARHGRRKTQGLWKLCQDRCDYRTLWDSQPPTTPDRALRTDSPPGPGTKLKQRIAELGISASAGCNCLTIARDMDSGGRDWCLANIDLIVGKIEEEVDRRGWGTTILQAMAASPIEFVRLAFAGLSLRGAIDKLVRDACS